MLSGVPARICLAPQLGRPLRRLFPVHLLLPSCARAAYARYIYIGSGAGPQRLLLQSGTQLRTPRRLHNNARPYTLLPSLSPSPSVSRLVSTTCGPPVHWRSARLGLPPRHGQATVAGHMCVCVVLARWGGDARIVCKAAVCFIEVWPGWLGRQRQRTLECDAGAP